MTIKFLILFVSLNLLKGCYGCYRWSSWSSCTVSCGGGIQRRTCLSPSTSITEYDTNPCKEDCYNQGTYRNGKCQCSPWRIGSCCLACRHVSLPQCVPGYQSCGGTPDGINCTKCNEGYYSAGYVTHSSRYSYACKACSTITNCKQRYCTSSSNTRCKECNYDQTLFKRTHSNAKCESMCAWNNHYCWPGSCSNDLRSGCSCAPDFKIVQTSEETTCQPTKLPSFLLCDITFIGIHGQIKQTNSKKDGVQTCSLNKDVYGNFHLALFQFELKTEFKIRISGYGKPRFIKHFKFGVTDLTINVYRNAVNGQTTRIIYQHFEEDVLLNKTINYQRQDNGSIHIDQALSSLEDGESLCVAFDAFGGGYLESVNLVTQKVNPPVQYKKVNTKRTLCYTYDNTPPTHCRDIGTCNTEPLRFMYPVTRSPHNRVFFAGWIDPIPSNGSAKLASSIQDYTVRVHKLVSKKGQLQVDYSSMYITVMNFSYKDTSLYLKPEKPTLYEVKLEVKDFAGNAKQARRFLLYDNTSFIETREDKRIIVSSASYLTNFKWQTHNTLCLSWKGHFYNKFYKDNNLLGPIHLGQDMLFSGVYEHNFGLLSIYGTLNVNGIIKFLVTVFLNDKRTLESETADLQSQSFCSNISGNDGSAYTIMLQAVDIAGNTFQENTTVFLDQSEPELELIPELESKNISNKNGSLVSIKLRSSSNDIKFKALDRHSGVRSIVWVFGSVISSTNIVSGAIKVRADTSLQSCKNGTSECGCYHGNQCEYFIYALPVNRINLCDDRIKDHLDDIFYISITVTNYALLNTTQYIDVEIDDTRLNKLCRTSNYMIAGVSSVMSVMILALVIIIIILVVRRKRQKNISHGSSEMDAHILESYENLEISSRKKSKNKKKDTEGTKVTKKEKIEKYQKLNVKDLCIEEPYNEIRKNIQTEGGKEERNQIQLRAETHIYGEIERTKVTKKEKQEEYQKLNVNDLCIEESYNKLSENMQTVGGKDERNKNQQRSESHIYEDIAKPKVTKQAKIEDLDAKDNWTNKTCDYVTEVLNDDRKTERSTGQNTHRAESNAYEEIANSVKKPQPENDSHTETVKRPPPENNSNSENVKTPPHENDSLLGAAKRPPPENDSHTETVKRPPPENDSHPETVKRPPPVNDSHTETAKRPPPENDIKIKQKECQVVRSLPDINVQRQTAESNINRPPPIPERCAVKQSNDQNTSSCESHIYQNLMI